LYETKGYCEESNVVIAPEITWEGREENQELFQVFTIFGPRRGSLAVLCGESHMQGESRKYLCF
jgi:hypothetical protein